MIYKQKTSNVNHYSKETELQSIDAIMALGLGFNTGNVIKYLQRHKDKGQASSLNKSLDYLYWHLCEAFFGDERPKTIIERSSEFGLSDFDYFVIKLKDTNYVAFKAITMFIDLEHSYFSASDKYKKFATSYNVPDEISRASFAESMIPRIFHYWKSLNTYSMKEYNTPLEDNLIFEFLKEHNTEKEINYNTLIQETDD